MAKLVWILAVVTLGLFGKFSFSKISVSLFLTYYSHCRTVAKWRVAAPATPSRVTKNRIVTDRAIAKLLVFPKIRVHPSFELKDLRLTFKTWVRVVFVTCSIAKF
jgi:hypothetical protein